MSSTARHVHSCPSTFAISPRFITARPRRFTACVSTSVSNQCSRGGSAAPRSRIFSEPIKRKVGSWERRSASLRSSYPARRLYIDWRNRSAKGNCVFLPRRASVRLSEISSLSPRRSSSSRTTNKPASDVTRDPWKSTFREELKEKWKGRFWFSPIGFIPPGRLHHVRTLINIDDYHAPRFQNYESKRKCGVRCTRGGALVFKRNSRVCEDSVRFRI